MGTGANSRIRLLSADRVEQLRPQIGGLASLIPIRALGAHHLMISACIPPLHFHCLSYGELVFRRDRVRFDLLRDFETEERARKLLERLFELARDFFFGGTLAPLPRASDNPMAIACRGFFTLRPDLPD
jgi:hypothetical protein